MAQSTSLNTRPSLFPCQRPNDQENDMKHAALFAVVAPLLFVGTALAQPVLKVKANTIVEGVQSSTNTVTSGQIVSFTQAEPQPYTYSYPSTTVGVPVSRAFTITDTANNAVELSIYQYSLTQVVGSCFSLIAGSLPNTVAFGTPLAVRYRMDSATAGPCKAVINMTTNASASPTFSFTLSGTVAN
jgi:hypothetical protein